MMMMMMMMVDNGDHDSMWVMYSIVLPLTVSALQGIDSFCQNADINLVVSNFNFYVRQLC